jgi:hypothetical protein
VQVVVLSITVLACIVLLVAGVAPKLDPVFAVAAIFFGIALIGHATFLWLTARGTNGPSR